MANAWKCRVLDHRPKCVLNSLMVHSFGKPYTYVTQETIRINSGVGRKSVPKVLKQLEKLNIISREPVSGAGKRIGTIYFLNFKHGVFNRKVTKASDLMEQWSGPSKQLIDEAKAVVIERRSQSSSTMVYQQALKESNSQKNDDTCDNVAAELDELLAEFEQADH